MKQVLLDPRTGRVSVVETPAPGASTSSVLVRTVASVISLGTERQLIELASGTLASKARARPEAFRQLLDTVRREGLQSAKWKADARLNHPFPLGYSLAGTVVDPGPTDLHVGQLVACSGAERAVHAELVSVSPMLATPVADGVEPEVAAFAGLGAIAIHACRLSGASAGTTVAVIGLGLVGQLCAQFLSASGVHVLAVEPREERRRIASEVPDVRCFATLDGISGPVDAVLLAASSDDGTLVDASSRILRDRGVVVVIGTMPIEVDRDAFYRRELSLVVARSLGPGRYLPSYEDAAVDLPPEYVRWTEGRNMSAFVDLCASGRMRVADLITHRFPIARASDAYDQLDGSAPLGVVLTYGAQPIAQRTITVAERRPVSGRPRIGVIGAGVFARGVLLPRLKTMEVELAVVCAASGSTSQGAANAFGFARATTDVRGVIDDPDVDAVIIATRHDLHATLAVEALRAGKSVYLEKPAALDRPSLDALVEAALGSSGILTVGHNRRFAPMVKGLVDDGPMTAAYVVNAAPIPKGHWVLDPLEGGGLVLAEGGHFIDLLSALCGQVPVSVSGSAGAAMSYVAAVQFARGSSATITYSSNNAGGPKEVLTVSADARHTQLVDFERLRTWTAGKRTDRRGRQDKGHMGSLQAFLQGLRSGVAPVPLAQVASIADATIALDEAIRLGTRVAVRTFQS